MFSVISEVVEMPSLIHKYDCCMNGCDKSDQMAACYGIHERRSEKWWKKLCHCFFQAVQVNSFILFQLSRNQQIKRVSFKQYKSVLIEKSQQQVVERYPADILQRKIAGRPGLIQVELLCRKETSYSICRERSKLCILKHIKQSQTHKLCMFRM